MLIRAHDLWRACASPRRAWNGVHHWARVSRHAELRYADVMRYRSELFADHGFQAHLARCHRDIEYSFSEVIELYVLVRALKPRVIVETGVASGVSSAHILLALAANGAGALHSIDLPNTQQGSLLPPGRASGWAVPDDLRIRWKLYLGDARELLPAVLGALEHVDVFLHDSDHSYEHMSFEFEQALPKLAHGGLLLSDDTHLHAAWDDFCATHGLRPGRVGHLGVTRNRRSA
ncbi:MAG: class I SAM-dependent methyltransferase [Nitrosotalea sp.]